MIVVRLRDGKDDDIREWYNRLPEGERSEIIRKVLKNYVKSIKNKTAVIQTSSKQKEYEQINIDDRIDKIIKSL